MLPSGHVLCVSGIAPDAGGDAQNGQIYEGTNQIQRMVMARQLLKG